MIKIFVIFISIIAAIQASYCGPYAVPYSLEHTQNGRLILGCARSPCLSVSPSHERAVESSNFQGDGFVRYDNVSETPQQYGNVICQTNYAPQSCFGPTQWVGGIIPGTETPNQSFQILCCDYFPLQFARNVGVASISQGQIYTGGDVTPQGELPSFDYISNVQQVINSNGMISYNAFIKRFSCPSTSTPSVIAYSAPNYVDSYGYGTSYYCFSGDSTVQLANGEFKRMDQLQIGDWVLTARNNTVVITRVDQWIHRKISEPADFLNIHLEDGTVIKMTAQHYIYKASCEDTNFGMEENMIFAKELDIGDCVYVKNGKKISKSRVTSIEESREMGYYAPLTNSGTIFVNNVFVSCHSSFNNGVFRKGYENAASWLSTMTKETHIDALDEVDLIPGFKALVYLGKSVLSF